MPRRPLLGALRLSLERLAGWASRALRAIRELTGAKALRLVLLAVAVVAAGWGAWFLTLGPVAPCSGESAVVAVPHGYSTAQIGELLRSKGLIRSPFAFRLWTRLVGAAGRLRAGEYELGYGMSAPRIAAKIARGQVLLHPVTIPEGYTVEQIAAAIQAAGFGDQARFRAGVAAAAGSTALPDGFLPSDQKKVRQPLEGYLFPDTYFLYRGISESEIVQVMLGELLGAFGQARLERARQLGMSVVEILTLASIVEKEAVVDAEREIISGVYHNRLRIGMKLDACPTVRYVMNDPTDPITDKELAIDSPYNTYLYGGLPPGPICSPGLASIDAALNPAKVAYLYFVSKNNGTHAFARTYTEHLANVRKYQ